MDKKDKKLIISLVSRYLLIIILGLNLSIISGLLLSPTLYLTKTILSLFYPTFLLPGSIIYFNSISVELIPSCISASAYFLLFILIFSTPNIKAIKMIFLVVLSFVLFFIINILRISFLALIYNYNYFNILHKFLWFFLSTMFVVIIWFSLVKAFKIKEIPIYSDILSLKKYSK